MTNIIQTIEKEEIARLGKKIPKFAPGDTVAVGVNVVEGDRKRVQVFEGVVIAKKIEGSIHRLSLEKYHLERVLREHSNFTHH